MIQRLFLSRLSVLVLLGFIFLSGVYAGGAEEGFEFRRAVFYPEPGLMLWTLITFLFLFAILKTLAWGPIINGLKNREDRIRKDLERAESAWKEAEAKANALSLRLEEAKAEALAILEEGRADALKLRNKLMEEAQHESDLIRERTKNDIGLAKQQALKEIWEQTALLSTQIASKIISKELSVEDHQDLVQSYLADYQKLSV
jgi:F-type H+-transporting ATPase subunit b